MGSTTWQMPVNAAGSNSRILSSRFAAHARARNEYPPQRWPEKPRVRRTPCSRAKGSALSGSWRTRGRTRCADISRRRVISKTELDDAVTDRDPRRLPHRSGPGRRRRRERRGVVQRQLTIWSYVSDRRPVDDEPSPAGVAREKLEVRRRGRTDDGAMDDESGGGSRRRWRGCHPLARTFAAASIDDADALGPRRSLALD